MAPKSILKKPARPPAPDADPAPAPTAREKRNLELALYHANLIQQQKDISNLILSNMEELLEHPLDSSTSAAPTAAAAAEFARLIAPFQPSDYDDLIEERYCAGCCGYALCPNPPRGDDKGSGPGGFRILRGREKGGGAQIVPREKLKKWCSEACARRAMYVRVQLSEQPAWERRATNDTPMIELLTDKEDSGPTGAASAAAATTDEDMRKAMASLALERGQRVNAAGLGNVLKDQIQESHPQAGAANAPAPSMGQAGSHANVEGYTPLHQDMRALKLEDDDDMG